LQIANDVTEPAAPERPHAPGSTLHLATIIEEVAGIRLTEELKATQLYARSLIESNIDALMTTDPLGVITDVKPADGGAHRLDTRATDRHAVQELLHRSGAGTANGSLPELALRFCLSHPAVSDGDTGNAQPPQHGGELRGAERLAKKILRPMRAVGPRAPPSSNPAVGGLVCHKIAPQIRYLTGQRGDVGGVGRSLHGQTKLRDPVESVRAAGALHVVGQNANSFEFTRCDQQIERLAVAPPVTKIFRAERFQPFNHD
jgi:hypothetical protein